jgi:IS30 family transposase
MQLTREERYQIYALKSASRISSEDWERVEQFLREDWSPEQVSNWLQRKENIYISHEWIYQHILRNKRNRGDLYQHRRCQKPRKKRYGAPDSRGQLKGRVSVDERPDVVNERSRIGDWEADTVIGQQGGGVLVTLVERRTRLSVIGKASNRTARKVTDVILTGLTSLAAQVQTLTYDNGKEFALHQKISKELDASGDFAHPYHSWEPGLNENTNGLIRQYLSKGKDLSDITDAEVRDIMNKQQSSQKMPWVSNSQSDIFWYRSTCCTSELNSRNKKPSYLRNWAIYCLMPKGRLAHFVITITVMPASAPLLSLTRSS